MVMVNVPSWHGVAWYQSDLTLVLSLCSDSHHFSVQKIIIGTPGSKVQGFLYTKNVIYFTVSIT